jgi:hypothetical protein
VEWKGPINEQSSRGLGYKSENCEQRRDIIFNYFILLACHKSVERESKQYSSEGRESEMKNQADDNQDSSDMFAMYCLTTPQLVRCVVGFFDVFIVALSSC